MRAGGLTERYVKALTGMALDEEGLKGLSEEITAFATIYQAGPELREVLENPAFRAVERKAVLDRLAKQLGASTVCRNFLFLLTDKKRTRLLPEVARELARYLDVQSGVVGAHVRSAEPLTKAQVTKLTKVLAGIQGQPVRVEPETDPTLIGGLAIEMAGRVYDGSVKKRLATIRELILEGAG